MAMINRPNYSLVYFISDEGQILSYPTQCETRPIPPLDGVAREPLRARMKIINVDDPAQQLVLTVESPTDAADKLAAALREHESWLWPQKAFYAVHGRSLVRRLLHWAALRGNHVDWVHNEGYFTDLVESFHGYSYLQMEERRQFDPTQVVDLLGDSIMAPDVVGQPDVATLVGLVRALNDPSTRP